MKLTKREKRMLYALGAMVFLFGYFRFIISPQINKLRDLKETKASYYGTARDLEMAIASKETVEREILKLRKNVETASQSYFSSIDQGTIILLLEEWVEKANIQASSISFSEYRVVEMANHELDVIIATLPFEGDYQSLINLLREIRGYEKNVTIGQMQIQNNLNNGITGSISIEFHSIRDLAVKQEVPYIVGGISNRVNPFAPFKGYVAHMLDLWEQMEKAHDYDRSESSIETSSKPLPPKNTIILLQDFDTLNTFFVGEPREIIGELSLSPNSNFGRYSLQLNYDFLRPRQRAVANVVFEGEKILLDTQPDGIKLSVYAFTTSNHGISFVLKDAKGKEYITALTQQINWTGWKNLEAKIPMEVSYPVEIQRIIITAEDFSAVTNGTLLFNQLEAVYPTGALFNRNPASNRKPPSIGEATTYEVQAGDTLFSITKRFYQDYSKRFLLMEANNITDSNQIYVGQRLVIPNGNTSTTTPRVDTTEYVVKSGDTLFSITRQFYNDDVTKRHLIMEYNAIKDPNDVKVGQRLLIPRL